jgi:hypothetical protein
MTPSGDDMLTGGRGEPEDLLGGNDELMDEDADLDLGGDEGGEPDLDEDV